LVKPKRSEASLFKAQVKHLEKSADFMEEDNEKEAEAEGFD
jgi:hypothetical protein